MNEWTNQEIIFLKQKYSKMSYKDMSLILNRSTAAIGCKITDLCIADNKHWTKKDLELLRYNYTNKTPKEICDILSNRKWLNIKSKANSLGLKLKSKSMGKILGDTSILLNDNNEIYYWIGFILADGHITPNNRLRITLTKNEVKHLDLLRQLLKLPKSSLKIYKNTCTIAIMDNFNLNLLKQKFDIKNNKTYYPPDLKSYQNLDDNLFWALIIGFIDGDGSINIRNYSNKMCLITIKNHKSWFHFHQMILNKLNQNIIHKVKVHITQNKYCYICISQNKIIKFLKQQIINLNIPYLKRKWDKIDINWKCRTET
jgi:hypothetical protein